MSGNPVGIGRFVLRCALALAPCYAAWYVASPAWAWLCAWGAKAFVAFFHPGLLGAPELHGATVAFVTSAEARTAAGAAGNLVAEANTLLYTHGAALFAVLMVAARAPWRAMPAGLVALLPFQAWGVAFDVMAQVAVRSSVSVAARAGFGEGEREVVALGYQVGALMLPVLAPVALWALFNRAFVAGLAGRAT